MFSSGIGEKSGDFVALRIEELRPTFEFALQKSSCCQLTYFEFLAIDPFCQSTNYLTVDLGCEGLLGFLQIRREESTEGQSSRTT